MLFLSIFFKSLFELSKFMIVKKSIINSLSLYISLYAKIVF